MGGFLFLVGMLGMLFGLVNVIYPIARLGIKTRKMAAFVLLGGFVIEAAGAAMMPPVEPKSKSEPVAETAQAEEETGSQSGDDNPTPEPEPTKEEPAAEPEPEQKPAELTYDEIEEASGLKGITRIESSSDQTVIGIHYTLGSFWDDTDAVKMSARNAVKAFEGVFALPGVEEVGIWSDTTFNDQYGKAYTDTVIRLVWTKRTADQIEWKNFKDMVLLDYRRAFFLAKSYSIHQSVYWQLNDRQGLYSSGGTGE